MEVFQAHNIGYFFYNGGGDSQDTADKLSKLCIERGLDIKCIGIPKTIDNDLPYTDTCPGFGSVAKYIATSISEAGLDVKSMSSSSTKVFILEVMGRHAGWIAASSALAKKNPQDAPHTILFPEVAFNKKMFLKQIDTSIKKYGFCTVVASEGIKDSKGKFLSESGLKDAFGHSQLGGVAPKLSNIIMKEQGYKCHYAIADYLQRSARHIASKVDLEQAYSLGLEAVKLAENNHNAIMPVIIRKNTRPYKWTIDSVALSKIANIEKKLPKSYISSNSMYITKKCYDYLYPLIQGEASQPFKDGLPEHCNLKNILVKKKLKPFNLKK